MVQSCFGVYFSFKMKFSGLVFVVKPLPFLGAVRDEGLKNFLTVVTLRVFSLVFFSSNLEKGPREAWLCWACGGVACAWDWAPWLLA